MFSTSYLQSYYDNLPKDYKQTDITESSNTALKEHFEMELQKKFPLLYQEYLETLKHFQDNQRVWIFPYSWLHRKLKQEIEINGVVYVPEENKAFVQMFLKTLFREEDKPKNYYELEVKLRMEYQTTFRKGFDYFQVGRSVGGRKIGSKNKKVGSPAYSPAIFVGEDEEEVKKVRPARKMAKVVNNEEEEEEVSDEEAVKKTTRAFEKADAAQLNLQKRLARLKN